VLLFVSIIPSHGNFTVKLAHKSVCFVQEPFALALGVNDVQLYEHVVDVAVKFDVVLMVLVVGVNKV
jgi:hypothetical protein